MANPHPVTYLFDPLCGWCYGASPTLETLLVQPELAVELAPTGLFAGDGARPMDHRFAAYAWSNDQRISDLTGQPFSEDYRRRVLGEHRRTVDSGPATLALTAVALTTPEREFQALQQIQRARYVEGLDNTDVAVLADVLRALNLHAAAERLGSPDDALLAACQSRVEAARNAMRRLDANGVPCLIVGASERQRLIRASALFGDMNTLLAELRAA